MVLLCGGGRPFLPASGKGKPPHGKEISPLLHVAVLFRYLQCHRNYRINTAILWCMACVPCCLFLFLCNLIAYGIFLCSWYIRNGSVPLSMTAAALFFALQSAVQICVSLPDNSGRRPGTAHLTSAPVSRAAVPVLSAGMPAFMVMAFPMMVAMDIRIKGKGS